MSMYCGTNKTALSSQHQIAEAFLRLLRENKYSDISISAICKEAGISRQTFYSLFSSKENLVIYELDTRHTFTPGSTCECSHMTLHHLAREYSRYMIQRRELLSLLVRNDVIYLMHDCLYRSFLDCGCFLPDVTGDQRKYVAEFVSGGLSGIAKVYAGSDKEVSEEEMEQIIHMLFSGAYVTEAHISIEE